MRYHFFFYLKKESGSGKCSKWNWDLMLTDTSEIRFPSGLWSCGWSRPGGERDCWVQPSEFSYDQSFLFIHSFAFIIRTPEGFVDLQRGWDATVCPNFLVQMCEILYMVELVLQSFVLVLWLIQRDLLCSAAAFYNTSSLKKSRRAHRVLCVHGSVCVCLHVSLSAVSCVCSFEEGTL